MDKKVRKKEEEISILDKAKSFFTNSNVKKLKKKGKDRYGRDEKKGN